MNSFRIFKLCPGEALRRKTPFCSVALTFLLCLFVCLPVHAERIYYPLVPTSRLSRNLHDYLKAHHNDPAAYFQLGRLHYLIFITAKTRIPASSSPDPKYLTRLEPASLLADRSRHPKALQMPVKEILREVTQATSDLHKAIKMAPKRAVYHLILASTLDQASTYALAEQSARSGVSSKTQTAEQMRQMRKKAMRDWQHQALAEYRKAFGLAVKDDLAMKLQPMNGLKAIVSLQAAKAYISLVKSVGTANAHAREIKKMQQAIKTLEQLPPMQAL